MGVSSTPAYRLLAAGGYVESLKHARLLYASVLSAATATDEVAGYEASNALREDTYSSWRCSGAASITATFTAAQIDCVCIGGHTLSGLGVTVEYRVGSDWTEVADLTPENNRAVMVLFSPVTADAVRVTVTGAAKISVLSAGVAMQMPHKGYVGLPAIALTRRTVFETNISGSGQWLGRSITRLSRPVDCAWQNLPEAWVRGTFDAFSRAARTAPFFLAPRPSGSPDDVGYMWVDEDIIPTRQGLKDLMSVSFAATVLGEAE